MLNAAATAVLAMACAQADAQSNYTGLAQAVDATSNVATADVGVQVPIAQPPAAPSPVLQVPTQPAPAPVAASNPLIASPVAPPLDPTDSVRLRQAIQAAQAGDTASAKQMMDGFTNPVARKLILWTMIDSAGTNLNFFDLDSARRDLWGWPRSQRRQNVTEKSIEAAGISPQRVVDWFEGKTPDTPEGAMALAAAYQQLNRPADAQSLIRGYWRDHVFELDAQTRMMSRFGSYLTQDDYAKRLDLLLYGPQGPAAKALMDVVDPDTRALADARIALRANRDDANDAVSRVPAALQSSPALAFEKARYLRKHNLDSLAAALIKDMPVPPAGYPAAATSMWEERRALMMDLLRQGDSQDAYAAAADAGLPPGEDYYESEFFAGWIALKKLNNPAEAAKHFANIARTGSSPITMSRALYWEGRAADAMGDKAGAQAFWTQGGKYYTAFYGQLSAEKAGQTTITLPHDPMPTAADRARFEGRDLVKAARMLADAGSRDLFRTFVLTLDDQVPSAEELAMLVDMARLYGDQDLAMRVVRAGAVRGLYLPERGYPVRPVPAAYGAPEPALVHAIIRQESGFDPSVRSGVGAKGMMQLMPATASNVARKLGLAYSADRLGDADYNMELGAAYLGSLVQDFGGSYVMAAAAYNAGPGRPAQWAADCGDPRGGTTDPSDFIECIPFAETRNYVMRIMEATEVYRARMNGGTAPLMAMTDLKRGGWGVNPPIVPYQVASLGSVPNPGPASGLGAGPVPYSSLAQKIDILNGRGEERRIDVSTRDDSEHCQPAKVKKTTRHGKTVKVKAKGACKAGGKSKTASRLDHKAKVAKAKGNRGKGGPVRHRKSRP